MEMPSEQVITRMLSSIGGVPLANLRSGSISDDDWVRITSATSQLSEAKIFVDETPALTPTELRARARRVKREHGLDLVVVDYLQLMQVPGTKENRATEIAEISRGLKVLRQRVCCLRSLRFRSSIAPSSSVRTRSPSCRTCASASRETRSSG